MRPSGPSAPEPGLGPSRSRQPPAWAAAPGGRRQGSSGAHQPCPRCWHVDLAVKPRWESAPTFSPRNAAILPSAGAGLLGTSAPASGSAASWYFFVVQIPSAHPWERHADRGGYSPERRDAAFSPAEGHVPVLAQAVNQMHRAERQVLAYGVSPEVLSTRVWALSRQWGQQQPAWLRSTCFSCLYDNLCLSWGSLCTYLPCRKAGPARLLVPRLVSKCSVLFTCPGTHLPGTLLGVPGVPLTSGCSPHHLSTLLWSIRTTLEKDISKTGMEA